MGRLAAAATDTETTARAARRRRCECIRSIRSQERQRGRGPRADHGSAPQTQPATPERLDSVVGPAERHLTGFEWLWAYFTHTAHHRAQAEVYLRVKGIQPPDYMF